MEGEAHIYPCADDMLDELRKQRIFTAEYPRKICTIDDFIDESRRERR